MSRLNILNIKQNNNDRKKYLPMLLPWNEANEFYILSYILFAWYQVFNYMKLLRITSHMFHSIVQIFIEQNTLLILNIKMRKESLQIVTRRHVELNLYSVSLYETNFHSR